MLARLELAARAIFGAVRFVGTTRVAFLAAALATSGGAQGCNGPAGLTASLSSGTTPSPSSSAATEAAPRWHLLGRFDTSDTVGPRFSWPGSAIAATFTGTGLSVKLRDSGTNQFAVVIDRRAPVVLSTNKTTDTYSVASNLPTGQHSVLITKRTESYVGVVQLLGLAPQGGALVVSPMPLARRIEFIGDSITCGYGTLGSSALCHFTPDTEDETSAYGALAAAQLNAQQTAIAYSGIGMYRNGGGDTANTMPTRFQRTLADDPASTWTFNTPPPHVVVVNLGTNDFGRGDPGPPFQQAYVAFLRQLRARYPDAHVICTLSPMLSDGYPAGVMARTKAATYIKAAVQQRIAASDAHVSYFEFDEQRPAAGYGCDFHPNAKTQQFMAAKLVPVIRSLTGW
jgi:lysophospholipase L1-like esterase